MKKKNTKSKHKLRQKCPECGSVVVRSIIDNVTMEYCNNDLIPEYAQYFTWFNKQEGKLQGSIMQSWDDTKHNLFSQWYISTQDPYQPFECLYRVDPRAKLITPSKCSMTIPDTAQLMIAEKILRRPLTESEKCGIIAKEIKNPDGSRDFIDIYHHIPLIDEEGNMSEGRISHIVYPDDVSVKFKDLTPVYNPELMTKLFDWEDL